MSAADRINLPAKIDGYVLSWPVIFRTTTQDVFSWPTDLTTYPSDSVIEEQNKTYWRKRELQSLGMWPYISLFR